MRSIKNKNNLLPLLKYFFAVTIIVVVIVQNFSKTVILLQFESNREEIARTFCVKKNEPDNCCKGSCHLKKQLEQQEEKAQEKPTQNKKTQVDFFLFLKTAFRVEVSSPFISCKTYLTLSHEEPIGFLSSVDHPPDNEIIFQV